MRAHRGDTLIIETEALGQPVRRGRITEVASESGEPPYQVHWEDGVDSLVFPGPDARIVEA